MIKKILTIILVLMLSVPVVYAEDQDDYTIGILSFNSKEATLDKWQPLADYLSERVSGQTFCVEALFYTEFEEAINSKSIDYILTNPAHYIAIGQEFELSGAIATLTELYEGKPMSGFGGVIFTKNTQHAPKTLEELENKKISAVSQSSLGGYQASAYELLKIGIDLDKVDFVLTGMPHSNAVQMVLNDQADAGFARSGVIESLIKSGEINEDDLLVLNSQTYEDFNQLISTPLYPEWPFIALSHIEKHKAQRVAAALYLMDENQEYIDKVGISGFTIPANYLDVELMMRALKQPPFDQEEDITMEGIWKQYNAEIIIALFIILIISSYAFYKAIIGKVLREKNETLNNLTDQLQQSNDCLKEISIKDALTGLYNRRYFEEYIEEKLQLIYRHDNALAVCVIDIDNFKYYNDTFGHAIGDLVLKEVANTLNEQVLRSLDMVARYAGDEFVIVLYDVDNDNLEPVAERIVNSINNLRIGIPDYDKKLTVSISMGITTAKGKCKHTSTEIFQKADQALFRAKDEGKNCYQIDYCHCTDPN
ncbi:diguanylate cyclase [Acidaminobacter sp. JC074]|uniref:diguanylate cyclase n=1 Tax=Acidaminobacter sp. JC074 TaxID=2530199 RepID=UPI001F0DA4AC|nr:diguanylate cyclase [Acidaminobacter sp. JC074]MCH4887047.1 diguanylate cyclase [Acidaminobacter sp. JC074]